MQGQPYSRDDGYIALTNKNRREDVVEAEFRVLLVQEVEGDGEANADDEHVRDEAVTCAGSIQGLAEGTPSDGVAVVRLHLLAGPDVAALDVQKNLAVARDDRSHNGEVEQCALEQIVVRYRSSTGSI